MFSPKGQEIFKRGNLFPQTRSARVDFHFVGRVLNGAFKRCVSLLYFASIINQLETFASSIAFIQAIRIDDINDVCYVLKKANLIEVKDPQRWNVCQESKRGIKIDWGSRKNDEGTIYALMQQKSSLPHWCSTNWERIEDLSNYFDEDGWFLYVRAKGEIAAF